MKKLVFLFACLFSITLNVSAGNDKPIQVTELPKVAQQFIQNHFGNQSVAMAKMETDFMDKSYDVIFTNGDKVEFNKKGQWKNVDCKHTQVPQAIIPMNIQKYVAKNYPDAKILKIEVTDRKGYDIDLNNGFDIEFDKKFRVIEIDR